MLAGMAEYQPIDAFGEQFAAFRRAQREAILSAFAIPASLLGTATANTRTDLADQRDQMLRTFITMRPTRHRARWRATCACCRKQGLWRMAGTWFCSEHLDLYETLRLRGVADPTTRMPRLWKRARAVK